MRVLANFVKHFSLGIELVPSAESKAPNGIKRETRNLNIMRLKLQVREVGFPEVSEGGPLVRPSKVR